MARFSVAPRMAPFLLTCLLVLPFLRSRTLAEDDNQSSQTIKDLCTGNLTSGLILENNTKDAIYCHRASPKEIHRLFASVTVSIKGKNGSLFSVTTSNSLNDFAEEKFKVWGYITAMVSKQIKETNATLLDVSPFEDSFFKISMNKEDAFHTIEVKEKWFDRKLLLQFLAGIFIFWAAKSLCRHISFIYLTGFSFGIFISWLLLLLLVVRYLPAKRGLVTSVLLLGTNFGLYVANAIFDHFLYYVFCNPKATIIYFTVVGLVTFAVMYYYDPGRNVRFLNLVQWTFQLIGCYLVFIGTRIQEVSVTLIVGMITAYVVVQFVSPYKIMKAMLFHCIPYRLRYKVFPPKRRLLTNEEFEEEGRRQKAEELETLRAYCSSPECDTWELVSRLKDPKRFALFMNNSLDVTQEEMESFEQWEDNESRYWFTSDEDDTLDPLLEETEENSVLNNSL